MSASCRTPSRFVRAVMPTYTLRPSRIRSPPSRVPGGLMDRSDRNSLRAAPTDSTSGRRDPAPGRARTATSSNTNAASWTKTASARSGAGGSRRTVQPSSASVRSNARCWPRARSRSIGTRVRCVNSHRSIVGLISRVKAITASLVPSKPWASRGRIPRCASGYGRGCPPAWSRLLPVNLFHLLAVLGQRRQADLGPALVHVCLVLDRLWFQLAVLHRELRPVDLLLPLARQDPVGQVGEVRRPGVLALDRVFEQFERLLLERPVWVGVLGQKPGRVRAVEPDHRLAGPTLPLDDPFEPLAVALVRVGQLLHQVRGERAFLARVDRLETQLLLLVAAAEKLLPQLLVGGDLVALLFQPEADSAHERRAVFGRGRGSDDEQDENRSHGGLAGERPVRQVSQPVLRDGRRAAQDRLGNLSYTAALSRCGLGKHRRTISLCRWTSSPPPSRRCSTSRSRSRTSRSCALRGGPWPRCSRSSCRSGPRPPSRPRRRRSTSSTNSKTSSPSFATTRKSAGSTPPRPTAQWRSSPACSI